MPIKRKARVVYVIAAGTLLVLEIYIALFVRDSFVRPYLGDALVVMLVYSTLMALTSLRAIPALLITLLLSLIVEISQFLELVNLLGWQKNRLAQLVLGTSFSWEDLVMYCLGGLVIYILEKST
jgi:hypothetical protein